MGEKKTNVELLRNRNIPVVILKGVVSSIYYPHQDYRSLGDVDFLVLQEHFEKAKEILRKDGIKMSLEITRKIVISFCRMMRLPMRCIGTFHK